MTTDTATTPSEPLPLPDESPALPAESFTSYHDGLATLSVTGLNPLGGDSTNPKYHRFNNFQFRDNITYNHGINNLKIGGDVQMLQYYLLSDFTSMGLAAISSTSRRGW